MQNESQGNAPLDESQDDDLEDSEGRRSRLVGRLRRTVGAAREGLTGTVDTVTGVTFREQFEDFTDAVTTTVIGVHEDQVELRERLFRLEQRPSPVPSSGLSQATVPSKLIAVSVVLSFLAVLVSVVALLKAFGAF